MEEVATPFRTLIPAGTSTFDVKVPKHYLTDDRKFYFNQLHVSTDFFNKEADLLGLDADPEMDKMVNYPVQVKLEYKDIATFYGLNYKNSSATNTTLDLIEKINEHFETQKPDFVYATPFFIDWIDEEAHATKRPEQYVQESAFIYYDDYFRQSLHGGKLPASVQSMDDVNNFLPPIGTMRSDFIYETRIRLRIWMGPFTRAVFSSNEPFVDDLGFTFLQFGEKYKNQYHLTNKTHLWRPVLIAERAPKLSFTKLDFRMTVAPFHDIIRNRLDITSLSKRDWANNDKVAFYLKNMFSLASIHVNTVFSFGYNTNTKQFYFHLPTSDNLSIVIMCGPEFALRLGFGQETFITKGMHAQPQHSILDAHNKALAVVFDTGPIICTLDNIASNTTSGAEDRFMAALYPHMSGTLSMPDSGKSHAVHLNILRQSTAAFIPITFRLIRIYDDEKSANFNWNNDAYVYGIFSGACHTSKTYKYA